MRTLASKITRCWRSKPGCNKQATFIVAGNPLSARKVFLSIRADGDGLGASTLFPIPPSLRHVNQIRLLLFTVSHETADIYPAQW
jgi:hypothetical protein